MNTTQAANRLGITPRALRRLVRKHSSLNQAGMGGQYDFSDEDLEVLEELMDGRKRKPDGIRALDQDPGVSVETVLLAQRDPEVRRYLQEKRRAREARLRDRLNELKAQGVLK